MGELICLYTHTHTRMHACMCTHTQHAYMHVHTHRPHSRVLAWAPDQGLMALGLAPLVRAEHCTETQGQSLPLIETGRLIKAYTPSNHDNKGHHSCACVGAGGAP